MRKLKDLAAALNGANNGPLDLDIQISELNRYVAFCNRERNWNPEYAPTVAFLGLSCHRLTAWGIASM